MLSIIFNFIHLFGIFIPIYIYFIPTKYLKKVFKYIFLIFILIPIHWAFFDDKCVLTILTKKVGDTKIKNSFSEVYLKWLYHPCMTIIGWDWNNKKDLKKMIYLHHGINFVLLWYYIFYVAKCKLK